MAYKNPEDARRWHEKNHARKLEYMRRYREEKRAQQLASARRWRAANPERTAAHNRAYSAANKDELREYKREWQARQRETNDNFVIKQRLHQRVRIAIKSQGGRKCAKSMDLLGCSIEFFRGWLEDHFQPGMTWENKGKWHIDHIIPYAEFDLRDELQQLQCFHYTNLQPLWGADNIKKGAKRPEVIE